MVYSNKAQLKNAIVEKYIKGLMEYLAKKIEITLKENLRQADISTMTLQDYVTHTLEKITDGYKVSIWIDSALAQSQRAGSKTWLRNGRVFVEFMSLDGSQAYGGRTIVGNMVHWLEETGAYGPMGNNPIYPIGMFAKTKQDTQQNLKTWINSYKI